LIIPRAVFLRYFAKSKTGEGFNLKVWNFYLINDEGYEKFF
jgi:hypothetical protein